MADIQIFKKKKKKITLQTKSLYVKITLNGQYEWLWMSICGPQGELESLVDHKEQWKTKKKRSGVKWIECAEGQMCRGWIKHLLALQGFNSLKWPPSSYLSNHAA